MLQELGKYITTQCYFSAADNELNDRGEVRRKISRTDVVYSNYIYRRWSDTRPDQIIPKT